MEWWDGKIRECEDAENRVEVGNMYQIMRETGVGTYTQATTMTTDDFRLHFSEVSKERYEVDPTEMRRTVAGVEDISRRERMREAYSLMNEVSPSEVVLKEMGNLKDSTQGEDGVRMRYIKCVCLEVGEEVVRLVRYMFENRADRWEESLKVGVNSNQLNFYFENSFRYENISFL